MPWLSVNQTWLCAVSAVPTPLFALEVQRAVMPGAPGAGLSGKVALLEQFQVAEDRAAHARGTLQYPRPAISPSKAKSFPHGIKQYPRVRCPRNRLPKD